MQRILVIRLSAMGDVAMTVPVLTHLLDKYSNVHLDILTRQQFRPIFPSHDRIGFIHPQLDQEHKGLIGLYKLFRSLRINQYDAVADLHDVLRSQILRTLFSFVGVRVEKINKGRFDKNKLTKKNNKKLIPLKSTHQRYAEVFESLGFPLDLHNYNLSNTSSSSNQIGIAPFAAHREKMWPLEKTEKLIDRILDGSNCDILLFGGGNEETEILNRIAQRSSRIISTASKSLIEQIDMMSSIKILVSMDSANMHLASNLGIPVVSIWGATHPFAGFLGFGQSPENCIQRDDLACRPCSVFGNKTCWRGDWACMDIDVEDVLSKLSGYLR